jgi:hypothetical protein
MIPPSAVLLACLACGATAAQPCGEKLAGAKRTIENSRYVIAYVTVPEPIVVGQHFVVDFAVCPLEGAAVPQAVRVDANMPEHRHGMNYRAGVVGAGPGLYRAEGLLFHMRGRWDLTFDVVTAGKTERLASTLRIE